MSYDVMDPRILDYELCAYGNARIRARGPKHDLADPHVVFMGATETFGKFIETPFPELLCKHLPAGPVNLGIVNGGIDAYLQDEAALEIARSASLRVVQVMGALNLSNSYFSVHPRRNDRLIRPHERLVRMFPEVDFADFHFNKAMLFALRDVDKARYGMVVSELRDTWLERMTQLLERLGRGTVLLWFAQRPPLREARSDPCDPMLVDRAMVEAVRAQCDAYVEIVPDLDMLARGTEGMQFGVRDREAARQMMGPSAHQAVATALQEPCLHLIKK